MSQRWFTIWFLLWMKIPHELADPLNEWLDKKEAERKARS